MPDFTNDQEIFDYIGAIDTNNDPLRHAHYNATVKHMKEMAVHVEGASAKDVLLTARPNEPLEIFTARMDVYEPITKAHFQKVLNVLGKIESANNYSVNFGEVDSSIPEGETLQNYTENLPVYDDVLSWAFKVALKMTQSDPNGVVVWMPKEVPENDADFLKPIPIIYNSKQIMDYMDGKYFTFLVSVNEPIKIGGSIQRIGHKFKIVTDKDILIVTEVARKGNDSEYVISKFIGFDFGEPPVYFLKGDPIPGKIPVVYESFSSGILPFWNKAIRMDSDLDAQYITHSYLERVEIEVECDNNCRPDEKGTFVIGQGDDCRNCPRCNGTGFITGRSPYGVTRVKKETLDPSKNEFPGVTYIDKPTDIVRLGEEKLDKLIIQGFAALNMEIVGDVRDNKSGVAKALDRTELNAYLAKQSNNLFDNIIANAYKYINLWRYSNLVNALKLKENLPVINKPTAFDVVTPEMVQNDISGLRGAGVSDETLDILEEELIDKRFPNDALLRKTLKTIRELDPMPNKDESDKLIILNSGGTTIENYVISSNIRPFVSRAVEEDSGFLDNPFSEKMDKMREYAQELIGNRSTRIPIVDDTQTNPQGQS